MVRYVENINKKVVFFFSSPQINKYYFIILTIVLLFSLGGPFWVEISSNKNITMGNEEIKKLQKEVQDLHEQEQTREVKVEAHQSEVVQTTNLIHHV